MRIHCFQHVPFEGLGSIESWAQQRDATITCTRFWDGDAAPTQLDADLLVVMGGPMNIYEEDRYPWLADEKAYLRDQIARGARILGICLGAQLLADVLGGRVVSGRQKEIGWFPVERSTSVGIARALPQRFAAFHWHGDQIELPDTAVHIARNDVCRNQGFVHGNRVVGLQFHLETTSRSAQSLIDNCRNELVDGPTIQPQAALLARTQPFTEINAIMDDLLDAMMADQG